MPVRFLTRKQVAEELNISMAQTYALLRRGELRAAKIGGRGDYRIGREDLEAYIERTYAETEPGSTSMRSAKTTQNTKRVSGCLDHRNGPRCRGARRPRERYRSASPRWRGATSSSPTSRTGSATRSGSRPATILRRRAPRRQGGRRVARCTAHKRGEAGGVAHPARIPAGADIGSVRFRIAEAAVCDGRRCGEQDRGQNGPHDSHAPSG